MAVNRVQQSFRVRTDATAAQGGTPVWAAAQDTSVSLAAGNALRIRFAIANTGSTSGGGANLSITASRNGGAYAQLPSTAASNPVYSIDATAGASADNSVITTSLLTGIPGTFSGVGQYDFTNATSAITLLTGIYVEVEFAFKFQPAFIANGDTYDFRVNQSGVVLESYLQTPRITIIQAATQEQVTQVSLEQFTKQTFSPTQAQVTQVSLEQFTQLPFAPTPVDYTQIALEHWGSASGLTRFNLTQAAIEHWASIATSTREQLTQIALEHWASSAPPVPIRMQLTQAAIEHWATNITGGGGGGGGGVGTGDFQATQTAIEEWVITNVTNPATRLTQVAAEEWVITNVTNPLTRLTRIAIEEWVVTHNAIPPPSVQSGGIWLVGL